MRVRAWFRAILLFGLFSLTAEGFAFGQVGSQPAQPVPEKKYDVGEFSFSARKMRDPFEPVFLLKARKLRVGSQVPADKAKGLREGYELEELRLVGIVQKEKARYAMMEDLQGKGMLFKKGDMINPQLWIVDVVDSKVIMGYRTKKEVRTFEVEIQKR
jgi:Tfp pilus assembly protein PilP